MNFGDFAQCVDDENDLEKLIKLCNSYGLNQEETEQIIRDYKNGQLGGNDQSLEESFQQSLREIQVEENTSRRQQYSFKHPKFEMQSFKQKFSLENQDSLEQNYQLSNKKNPSHYNEQNSISKHEYQIYEAFMKERRQFENNMYSKLEEENRRLVDELRDKAEKVDLFMKMKVQDSQIILGLKDAINSLTKIVQEKEQNYQELQEKYERLQKEQQESVLNVKQSKSTFNHHESIGESDERKSYMDKDRRKSINTALLRQSQNSQYSKRIQRKESKKVLKEQSSNKNVKIVDNKENRDSEKHKRSNRIDIGKYKGMIEDLRNSYCQFR